MKERVQKHLPYFSVLEAIQKAKGCFLCELEVEGTRRHLGNILYEFVNDVDVRADLMRARGYCHRHAHVLLTFKDGLGTAILYQDQVRLFLRFIKTLQGMTAKVWRKSALAEWNLHEACPACRMESRSRQGDVANFLAGLQEEEMRTALEASPGLCVQHLLVALGTTQDTALRRYLLDIEEQRFRRLLHELEEYCRKQDYRFRAEGFGREADSWQRAVEMMVGRAGIARGSTDRPA